MCRRASRWRWDCPDLGDEVTLMVHGYDGDMRICTPIIRTGSELSASDTRGCLLEEQFAQAHNLSVGDTVKVSYGGVSLTFFVRGTILSGEYLVTAKNITPQPDIYGYMYGQREGHGGVSVHRNAGESII